MGYIGSHIWKLRQKIGHDLLLCPGSSVIVQRQDGAILLMQRPNKKWALIGGLPEEGQGFVATALRELKEESGIIANADDLTPFGSFSDPKQYKLTYENGDQVQIFSLGFILNYDSIPKNAQIDTKEVSNLKFFNLDELPNDMHPATKLEIEQYKKYLQTKTFQIA